MVGLVGLGWIGMGRALFLGGKGEKGRGGPKGVPEMMEKLSVSVWVLTRGVSWGNLLS